MNQYPTFARHIGIDYSGAETPHSPLKGLRVYLASGDGDADEVLPHSSKQKYLSRREIAEWLVTRLKEDIPTIIGIDHSFSFPIRYFEVHNLRQDWPAFLDDFQAHWPTEQAHMYVDFIRHGIHGDGAARTGSSRWRRACEKRCGAKSVFHFDVPGSVAKSTHAGIPWLRYLRQELGSRLHCWPFDGFTIPPGRSVVAEAYPKLCKLAYPVDGRTQDQHDAYSVAMWLRDADNDGRLQAALHPDLDDALQMLARVEGWILGVSASASTD